MSQRNIIAWSSWTTPTRSGCVLLVRNNELSFGALSCAARRNAMPSVLIEVRKRYAQEQETALIEAVHGAIREAFKIKTGDRNVRLVVHEPHRFACPPACEQPDVYTHITVDAFTGRSLDAKRSLYRAIVTNLRLWEFRRTT